MTDNRGPRLVISCWAQTLAAAIFLLLRIYCKLWRGKGLWLDDYLLCLACIMLAIAVSINTYIVCLGFGSHIDTISHDNLKLISLNTILVAAFGSLATSISKASFCVTLYRLTSVRWMRWLLIWIIVSVSTFLNLVWILGLLKCTPFERVIDSSSRGKCWNKQKLFKFQLFCSCYSAVMDFLLAFLPWPIIIGSSLCWRERVGVAIAMSLGVLAGVSAIVKTALGTSMRSADFTYERADLTIWTLAEPAASIMAISIPVLRMLYTELRTTYIGYAREGRGKYKSHSQTPRCKSYPGWQEPSSRSQQGSVIVSNANWQDSQEALQSRQNEGESSQNASGITKTSHVYIQHEQVVLQDGHSIELESLQQYKA